MLRSKKRKAEELLIAQRLPEARTAFEQLCQQNPQDYDAWLNLGSINGMLGLFDAAEIAFRKALALRNDEPRAHFNLARLCRLQERLDEAINHWHNYLHLKPDDAEGYAQLGKILHMMKQLPEAERAFREALRCNPNDANYHNNIGVMLHDLGRYDEALGSYCEALQLSPKMAEVYCNIGNLYHEQGEDALAEFNYSAALKINPANAGIHMSLGHHYSKRSQPDQALLCFRESLRLQPDYASARWNLALLLLASGKFREGWAEYDWRISTPEIKRPAMMARYSSRPLWDGALLTDKTLLIYVEQGFGDTLQFCRYLPLVMQRARHVIFECQPELLRLLSLSLSGIKLIATPADGALPAVDYDMQIPLMSLPRLFQTELDSVPPAVPYIHADPEQIALWQSFFKNDAFKVGLVWAGNPKHWQDKLRSMPLAALAPLATVQNVHFYSLQKGPTVAEAATPPTGMRLTNLTPKLDDFASTAAAIANLDLVITVDTAVAHLAGAMGKPVWTLIYSPPDWRWLLNREDSPWYPTMKLFRQTATDHDWLPVVERVVEKLKRVVSGADQP